MPLLLIEYRDEAERLALEQALACFTQRRQRAATAPDGSVRAACEQRARADGRALLRDTLASAVPARVEAAEQPGGPPGAPPARATAPAATKAATAAPRPLAA
jgi:hypothetical protein